MENNISRGSMLKGLITLPALAAAVIASPTIAEAKGSKAQLKYQANPKNGQKCSACRFYLPGKTAKANGACTLIAGAISPNGWCIAYQNKA